MELAKIIKLLMLTTSENDHEALAAIRMVNKAFKEDGHTWATIIQLSEPTPKPEPEASIREMLQFCHSHTDGFSVHGQYIHFMVEFWNAHRTLTLEDQRFLKNLYSKMKKSRSAS